MAFKGLRSFTGDEVGNLVIGQMGFAVVATSATSDKSLQSVGTYDNGSGTITPAANHPNKIIVAIKVMKNGSSNNVGFLAQTFIGDGGPGEDLDINNAADGDIIYGPFSYVQGTEVSTTTGKLICYFGGDQ